MSKFGRGLQGRGRFGQKIGRDEAAGAGHLEVESVVDEVGRVRGAPVRSDEALEADFLFQNLVCVSGFPQAYGPFTLLYEHMMDDTPGGHRIHERRDVDLVQRLRVDDVVVAAVVSDVVLGLRHHVLRLDATNHSRADLPGEQGSSPIGVVAAAEGDVAVDVDERLQDHVDTEGAGIAADHHAVLLGIFAAEGGGEAHGGGLRGGGVCA